MEEAGVDLRKMRWMRDEKKEGDGRDRSHTFTEASF
jgi:hypothetical protein